jgi:predicted ATPase
MRDARAKDARRRLRTKIDRWKFRIEGFAFSGIPALGEGDILFSSPFTVISGPNGVGKTTLLRAIWAAADPDGAKRAGAIANKLLGGKAALSFILEGTPRSSEVVIAGGEISGGIALGVDVVHLDSASEVGSQQNVFASFGSIENIVNGVGPKQLDRNQLSTISYLARRDYGAINLYEVEGGERVVPFYEISVNNDRYDSRTMGAGELALFYLWWAVERASPNSLLLIEEPECFISPASQSALCDYLIEKAVARRLTMVLTSHSPQVVTSLSDEDLIFAYRSKTGMKVIDGSPPFALLETIGILPSVNNIILVEDEAAVAFCHELLEQFQPTLSRRSEIVSQGGEANIVIALRRVGGSFKSLGIVGVFDGDQHGKIPEDVQKFSALLPCKRPIEVEFRELIESDPVAFKTATGREDVEVVLASLQGQDHHEWYEGLCRLLGVTRTQLYPRLFQLWLRVEANRAEAVRVVEAINALSQ